MKVIADEHKVSIKLSCRLCSLNESSYYYKSKQGQSDEVIKKELQELAEKHLRWGFDKMMPAIRQKGYRWNHKRVYRVYTGLGLNLRKKLRKRLPCREAVALVQPLYANCCWSIDFMTDVLRDRRQFRTLNVLDDYNREILLIEPSFSLPAFHVTRLLDQLGETRGYPAMIRVDNGPEFISKQFQGWAKSRGILVHYIQPGKPAQNAYIERFNRTYREDILDAYYFDSLREVKTLTREWMNSYNEDRPHEALNNLSPFNFHRKQIEQRIGV